MRCLQCRSELPTDAAFCPECGTRLEIACPACGTANAPGYKFCKRCGHALTPSGRGAPAPKFASPQAYTPKHLAEKILTSKTALEGERKQVTVLFADLKGSMELLADRDPEEEQMAIPGSILMPPETLRLAEGYVVVTPLGLRTVKGLPGPIEVFEVTGAGPVRSRLQAAAARGLTRFVGRESELDQLRQALERARTGHGQVVAVVGEAGVGKSRLYWEFTHSHRTHDWLIVESSSVSYGKATAFLPTIDLLKAYFQIEPADEARKIREKVTGRLLSLDRQLEPFLAALLWLLDVPLEDPHWEALEPAQRRQRALEGVRRLLLRESQVQPLLAMFEDFHWIDAETQALLDNLVESLPTARLLLLVNYRPEYQHAWSGKSYYRQLRIDPLPPENAEELLEALLGQDPGLQPLKRLLIEQTEGNPFFLEESVRTLVETQVLVGERGRYRLDKAPQTIQIPATAQAILAARIDRLPPEDKRLLQAASVIGKDVPFALLQAIAEESEDALRLGLSRLQAAEFVYEARLFPDLEYTFRHALTQEVAYTSLLQDRRRALHGRILDAIETLYPDRLPEHIERLARHAVRGERWDKALTVLRQAAAKAVARSAHREAVAYFEQALETLRHLPESRDTLEQAIDLRFDLRTSLIPLGEHVRIRDHLREAAALAERLGDQRRLGQVTSFMANYFYMVGEPERALEAGQRVLTSATALGDLGLRLMANFYLGQAHHILGDYRRAKEFTGWALAALEDDSVSQRFGRGGRLAVMWRIPLIWSLAELGEFAEAIARGEEAIQIAERADQSDFKMGAWGGVGFVYLRYGEHDKAIAVAERAVALSRGGNVPVVFALGATLLGSAYALSGRVADALPLLEQAVEQAAAAGFMAGHSLRVANLSQGYLHAGRVADAIEAARRALDLARAHRERGHEAWVLRLLGEISADRDGAEVDKAEECYRQAMALADELGMRPLQARCHLGLGTLYRRIGKRQEAREHLTTAATMLREMNMRFWLEQAEAELKG